MEETSPEIKIIINEMPSQELLQEYLRGLFSKTTVIFDLDEGVFRKVANREV